MIAQSILDSKKMAPFFCQEESLLFSRAGKAGYKPLRPCLDGGGALFRPRRNAHVGRFSRRKRRSRKPTLWRNGYGAWDGAPILLQFERRRAAAGAGVGE
jgi:hypothetical protein